MLAKLVIRNFGLIAHAEITAGAGFTVFTGETGAGKSMLIDALSLALGVRGGAGFVRADADSASIEATFHIPSQHRVRSRLEDHGIDHDDDELSLRRQMMADGKTRCFINGLKTTQQALKDIGEMLVDIHGQQDQQILMRPAMHTRLLDRFAGHLELADNVKKAYQHWAKIAQEITQLEAKEEAREKEIDLLQAYVAELDKLAPQEDEETALAEERQTLMAREQLVKTVGDVIATFGDGNMVSQLNWAQRRLAQVADKAGEEAVALTDRLADIASNLADVEADISRLTEMDMEDVQRLDMLDERLHKLRALARKHNVAVTELPQTQQQLQEQLNNLQNMSENLSKLQRDLTQAEKAFNALADELTAKRQKASIALAKKVEEVLAHLHMPHAKFKAELVAHEQKHAPHASGHEDIEFYVQTNPGSPFAPLIKAASGGEISRIMLALEVVFFASMPNQTLIFDEVDTGVGGAVAEAVGRCLAQLGQSHQVFAITHLPQVAARAKAHLKIKKTTSGETTTTDIQALTAKSREDEIARMLAGADITSAARSAAKSLLEAAV